MAGSPRSLLTAPDEGWKVPRSRQEGKEEPPGAVRVFAEPDRGVQEVSRREMPAQYPFTFVVKEYRGKTRARENGRSFNDELTRRRPRKELETSRGCSRGGKKRGPREEEEEEEDEPRIRKNKFWGTYASLAAATREAERGDKEKSLIRDAPTTRTPYLGH
ncbi:hypothetical protein RUM44_008430 [Polyplax serrata]|uniref:Uncharacterized protein n=1 Tax=Polyplax serrata TaxID=468196 RepID=A0ABR1BC89_POLSC